MDPEDRMLAALCRLGRLRIDADHGVEETSTVSGKLLIRRVHLQLTPTIKACVETCGDVLTVYAPELSVGGEVRSRPVKPMFTERSGKLRFLFEFDITHCQAIYKSLQQAMVLDALSDV